MVQYLMAFNRDFKPRGGRPSFNRGGFGGNRSDDRQMFSATCSNCGKECQVPFKPTGSKPVYCSDCFKTMGDGENRRPSYNRSNDRPSYSPPQNSQQLDVINAKLDKVLKLLSPEASPSEEPTE